MSSNTKFRLIASAIVLIALAIGFVIYGGNDTPANKPSSSQSDDGLVIH